MHIAVIVPVLNEDAATLSQTLSSASDADEIFIVDGGSEPRKLIDTREVASHFRAIVLTAPKGRASQMNAGAVVANSEWLLFLHADVQLPVDWRQQLISHLTAVATSVDYQWGRFDVRFRGIHSPLFKRVGWLLGMRTVGGFMNLRSRLTSVSTGDQAQFIQRQAFVEMNGFPEQSLMEDVEFSKRAYGKFGAPLNLSATVLVSARRWHKHGFFRTVFLMWRLRWQYWRGASPEALHNDYYGRR
jgi:rSAM/selenodomain-associated transferase 2